MAIIERLFEYELWYRASLSEVLSSLAISMPKFETRLFRVRIVVQ